MPCPVQPYGPEITRVFTKSSRWRKCPGGKKDRGPGTPSLLAFVEKRVTEGHVDGRRTAGAKVIANRHGFVQLAGLRQLILQRFKRLDRGLPARFHFLFDLFVDRSDIGVVRLDRA